MAKKAKSAPAPTYGEVGVIVYDFGARGFFERRVLVAEGTAVAPDLLSGDVAMVRNMEDHLSLVESANNGNSIVRDADGYATVGDALEEQFPPGLFTSAALGSRAIQIRGMGFYSLDDALALSDPATSAKIRAWAMQFNSAVQDLSAQVQAGTMTANRALAELPVYGGNK